MGHGGFWLKQRIATQTIQTILNQLKHFASPNSELKTLITEILLIKKSFPNLVQFF